jgi:hypothetical protein
MPIILRMNENSIEKSYYVKDTRGKLIILSEETLIEMIRTKTLKPSTKVFSKEFNKWMKVSDLSVYTNRSSMVDFDKSKDSESIQFSQASTQDSSVQIIQLMETIHDTQEFIYNARFEGLDKSKKISLKNNELESSLNDTLLSLNALELENKCLHKRINALQVEKIEYIKKSTEKNSVVENTKIKAEVKLLNKEFKLIELDLKNEIKVNNMLILQIEELRKESIELYERKEFYETQFNKINKEKIHFNTNIDTYKREVELIGHEKGVIQNQFDNLLQKYESFLNSENSFKEKYVDITKSLNDLEADHVALKNKLQQTNNEVKLKERIKINFDHELEKKILENKELYQENDDLKSELKQYKVEIENHKSLVEELKEVPALPQIDQSELIKELNKEIIQKDIDINQFKALEHRNIKNKSDTEKLKESLNAKNKVINDLKNRIIRQQESSVSEKEYKEVINKLKYYENSYTLLFNKSKEIALKWKSSQKEISRLKKANKSLREPKLVKEKSGIDLKSDIQTVDTIENHKITQHVNDVNSILSSNPLIEENNIGKVFKINCNRIWKINLPVYKDNIFTVFEVTKIINEKNIDKSTKVKILGKSWVSISDSFELNNEIIAKNIDGAENYFIQRDSIRIPVHQLVQINDAQDQIDCICVNLSRGGCLIEMQTLPLSVRNSKQITVVFHKNNNTELEVKCTIKNISDALGVYAIGLMFDQPSAEFKKWADFQIKDFSDENNLELAA